MAYEVRISDWSSDVCSSDLWEPLEAPAPGSYFSFLDVGSRNAVDHASVSFGGAAEDPESLGLLLDNPLSGITNTSTTIQRSEERRVGKGCVSTCRSRS